MINVNCMCLKTVGSIIVKNNLPRSYTHSTVHLGRKIVLVMAKTHKLGDRQKGKKRTPSRHMTTHLLLHYIPAY